MVLACSLDTMKIILKVGYALRLLPYCWSKANKNFEISPNKSRIVQWKFCMAVLFLLYCFSSIQFGIVILNGKEPISYLLLNAFSSALHTSGIFMILSTLSATTITCELFSCTVAFEKTMKQLVGEYPSLSAKKSRFSIEVCCTVTTLACILIVPPGFSLLSFIFPCHQFSSRSIAFFYPKSCSSHWFHLVSYLVEFSLTGIIAFGWGFQIVLLGIAIHDWNQSLEFLKSTSKSALVTKYSAKRQWKLLLLYRKCQLFTKVLNLYSQPFILPLIHCLGSAVTITCLYSTIMSDKNVPKILTLLSTTIMIINVCFVLKVLDIASKGLLCSKGFLRNFGKLPGYRDDIFRRYRKSLPPLHMNTGPFHVVDRGRAPALIKFCLQRTAFLVFKSTAS
ncbi:unnamed protein product [Orchesella dallaii]|uniref:Odorant receptor n=1 Tax=Orchesella dallaii TaxID=48710 RepID=A0ABP1S8Y5_9HEXA